VAAPDRTRAVRRPGAKRRRGASEEDEVPLTEAQAACLAALRRGFVTKTEIAVETRRDLREVSSALGALNRAGLIDPDPDGRFRWRTSGRGRACAIRVVAEPRRRGPKRLATAAAGSSAARLLDELHRPMRGAELARRLGLTTQRIRQLVVKLYAQGLVRLGDRRKVLFLVARSGDRTALLCPRAERALSAFPEEAPTTAAKLSVRTRVPKADMEEALARLLDGGLIEPAGSSRGAAAYRLSAKGRRHFQRRASGRRADPAPLKVKSDRVRAVLTHLAEQGPARIADVRRALGVPAKSMNALMQYLKRRGLARKTGMDLHAPYGLTAEGEAQLEELSRRSPETALAHRRR
jgi:DNA-binding IclR family transcriptional regulator